MNHRNLLILLGTACVGIAAGVAFFAQDSLATALPEVPEHLRAPVVEPVAEEEHVAATPAEGTFRKSDPVVAMSAPQREDTTGWTSGIIRGDVQLTVSVLDQIGSMTVIVEELRSDFAQGGQAPKRIMQPVERGRGTPTFEVRDIPFSEYPYRVTLHVPGLNGSSRTLSINEQTPLHEDVVLAITPGAPYSVLLRDQDGNPHRDIDVLLRPHGLPHGRPRLAAKTDSFGSVVFESVLSGQYELLATLDGQPFGEPEMVTVQPGKRNFGRKIQGQGHVMTIARGVQLDIEVGDGAYGIEGATVTVVRTDQRRLKELETTTDALGRASFPHLPAGQWQLTIQRHPFARVDRQLTLRPDMGPQLQRIRMARRGR
ncbi:MAG: carboxypeptidase regulatory-like domain-containing protein [Planctomycetes bacterium]|nr:carboxypeptidase regulatory-like domain-containing protein [Planctomycetota bacterium]